MTRRGRATALTVAAIVLLALTLRVAVASLSPVLDFIAADFAVPPAVVGLIGAAPPVAFAVFGIFTPLLARRVRMEALAAIAAGVSGLGLVARGLVGDATGLLLTTVVVFAGVGVGNVLMPALIKKYFPSRIALMSTVYMGMLSLATLVPPVVAVPIAESAGWRVSLGVWAAVAILAVVPWLGLLRRARRDAEGGEIEEANPDALRRLLRLPRTWALVAATAVSGGTVYSLFAWLPAMLQDRSGLDAAAAGALLGVFGGMGLPFALFIPWLVARYRTATPVVLAAILPGVGGVIGMLVAPAAAPWLWVVLLSLPTSFFPLVLVLFGLRTRTHPTTIALSAAAQSLGYAVGALFPITLGLLHDATGGWEAALLVLGALFVFVGLPAGLISGRAGYIEETWERRHGPW